ncbi:MAG: hypothetical protein COB76_06995, partial [Alphaproteobacteria bacterium]
MQSNGIRQIDPVTTAYKKLADEQGPHVSANRDEVVRHLHKAGRTLFPQLSKTNIDVVTALTGFTKDPATGKYIGWTDGGIPMVCASNRKLATEMGISEATLKRSLHALCKVGLISNDDSASRRRGKIPGSVGYYGINLSLLKIRLPELVIAYADLTSNRAAIEHYWAEIKSIRPQCRA